MTIKPGDIFVPKEDGRVKSPWESPRARVVLAVTPRTIKRKLITIVKFYWPNQRDNKPAESTINSFLNITPIKVSAT